MHPCLSDHERGVVLRLKVVPNASKTEARGLWEDRLRLRVQAPPVEGRANKAIAKWVAAAFGVRPSDVEILRGGQSSAKEVLLAGVDARTAEAILEELLA